MPAVLSREWLRVSDSLSLPLLRASGDSGPVLTVTAGIHGDEYEGVRALYELFEEMDGTPLRGTLVAVPIANPGAHRAVTRTNPDDGQNLARVFPGNAEGTASERIAAALTRVVISPADFFLDLHSGGVRYGMPSMAGYAAFDARGRAAAEAFGAPVIWGHPVIEPGRTISAALAHNVPFLYTEAWGAGRIRPEDLAMMKRGINNLLRHLGMLPGDPVIPAPPRRLSGAGNTDDGLSAGADGFLINEVQLLDRVAAGDRLGRLVNPLGETIETYIAPRTGTIGLTHEMPIVTKGDTLFLLADEE